MNSIEEYMKWVDGLPTNLQKIITDNWDITGRPTNDFSYRKAVIRLLNLSDTFKDFTEVYKAIFPTEFTHDDEYVTNEKIGMYWDMYMAGLKRAVDDLMHKKAA